MLDWHLTKNEKSEDYTCDSGDVTYSVINHYWDGVSCEASVNYYVFWRMTVKTVEEGKLKCEEFNNKLPMQLVHNYNSKDALCEFGQNFV